MGKVRAKEHKTEKPPSAPRIKSVGASVSGNFLEPPWLHQQTQNLLLHSCPVVTVTRFNRKVGLCPRVLKEGKGGNEVKNENLPTYPILSILPIGNIADTPAKEMGSIGCLAGSRLARPFLEGRWTSGP
eukprot:1160675-Pelagomonas_calceolata.AAC.8